METRLNERMSLYKDVPYWFLNFFNSFQNFTWLIFFSFPISLFWYSIWRNDRYEGKNILVVLFIEYYQNININDAILTYNIS